jgi:hypothetical protein
MLFSALAAVGAFAVFLYWRATNDDAPGPVVSLPDAEAIECITARVNDLRDNMGIRPVPEFVVPREHFPILLSVLTPAERNERLQRQVKPHPEIFPTIGHLTIATKQGKDIRIDYYFVGQSPLVFAVDGMMCQRGGRYMPDVPRPAEVMGIDEGLLLYHVIDASYCEGIKGHKTERFPELRRLIERSTGRPPLQPAK